VSELQKKIQRARRREGTGGMGFGAMKRELPRAMVLCALVSDGKGATAALEAGADVVIVDAASAADAAAAIKGLAKGQAGARLAAYDDDGAAALREAGCDFVISPLETTAATAVDTDQTGQVIEATTELSENTLRALAPLGLDGLYVARPEGELTLAAQLELVRLSSLGGAPLLAAIDATSSVAELRVLRDSGAGAVVAPAGATPDQLRELGELLRQVPVQGKSGERSTVAIIPSMGKGHAADDDEEDDADDE
jgi:hypothetical protein